MNVLLISLPILTFFVCFINIIGFHQQRDIHTANWKTAILQSSLILAGYLVVFSELLSLFNGLTRLTAAIAWCLGLSIMLWMGISKGYLRQGSSSITNRLGSLSWREGLVLLGVVCITMTLLVIALISPPNNVDSLLYHMSRVVHWAQNQSLRHYATVYTPQLIFPIGAELIILNLRLLWGNDQLANLVQWLSMVGCLIGVAGLTEQLGGDRKARWVAVTYAISIPLGILQSTSTQNDYVTAYWLICLLYFAVLAYRRDLHKSEQISFALALSLGMLTKGTFYPYALPVVLWYAIVLLRQRKKMPELFAIAVMSGMTILVLNLGYWARNFITFGGPLGPAEEVARWATKQNGVMSFIGMLMANTLANFVTPVESINHLIVGWFRGFIGHYDPYLTGFDMIWGWNHEDLAGSPLHALLVPVTLMLLAKYRSGHKRSVLRWYVIAILSMCASLAIVMNYALYSLRFHLPFFIVWAPVIGVALGRINKPNLVWIACMFFLVVSMPWVLVNRTRPLIAMRNSTDPFTIPCFAGCTNGSILIEPPESTVFGTLIDVRNDYISLARDIRSLPCQDIGLRLDSHDPEYLFWWLLSAPESGFRLETIYTYPELEQYLDQTFTPCAIICTTCNDEISFQDFSIYGNYANVKLYVNLFSLDE
ncbi:MAG: hypothetical protein ABIJ39_14490 [Chloroflexota bacterium]